MGVVALYKLKSLDSLDKKKLALSLLPSNNFAASADQKKDYISISLEDPYSYSHLLPDIYIPQQPI